MGSALKLEEQESSLSVVQIERSTQEESFATLIANIIVEHTLNQLYEEGNPLSAV